MDARYYPTWRDFDIPQRMVDTVKHTSNSNGLIGFLLNDRVFHVENKINYEYRCIHCGHVKILTRQYEDYSSCEKCNSNKVHGIPFWKENRGSPKVANRIDAKAVAVQLGINFTQYFGSNDNDILSVSWKDSDFRAKFVCGEEVIDGSPVWAITKAAILCPFLWDSNYNWRDKIKNDRNNNFHISHLIMQWTM